MEERMLKLYSKSSNRAPLHAVHGHFATSHSHINYYIDLTSLKTRVKEANEIARLMADKYVNRNRPIDTIICMDGTETVGTLLAKTFEEREFITVNTHDPIYVVTPEFNSTNQMMFRDNISPCIRGKNVVLLLATTTTGVTIRRSIECIEYYGGKISGICSIFSIIKEVEGYPIESIFTEDDVPGYKAYRQKDCPFCKNNIPIEAMVNGFGYSKMEATRTGFGSRQS